MLALLMCGGKGKRLGIGEKPLFKVCGKRLIEYALDELKNYEIIAVTSPYTPETEKFLRDLGIEVFRASGRGFIEDYREAIVELSITLPTLIVSSDLVYIRKNVVDDVVSYYFKSDKPALKVVNSRGAVGINVIDAFFIYEEQEEEIYKIDDFDIININTLEDVIRAEELCMMNKGKCLQRS